MYRSKNTKTIVVSRLASVQEQRTTVEPTSATEEPPRSASSDTSNSGKVRHPIVSILNFQFALIYF